MREESNTSRESRYIQRLSATNTYEKVIRYIEILQLSSRNERRRRETKNKNERMEGLKPLSGVNLTIR